MPPYTTGAYVRGDRRGDPPTNTNMYWLTHCDPRVGRWVQWTLLCVLGSGADGASGLLTLRIPYSRRLGVAGRLRVSQCMPEDPYSAHTHIRGAPYGTLASLHATIADRHA